MESIQIQAVHLVVGALARLPAMERQRALADLDIAARERQADFSERRVSEQQWVVSYVLARPTSEESDTSPWDAIRPETD